MKNKRYNLSCENRSETQRDFHKNRIAFLIYNKKVYYIENVDKSHFELAQELGLTKEIFDTICRGFFFKDYVVFYKGHFTYDKKMIEEALETIDTIKNHVGINNIKVYVGQKIGSPNEIWPPDKFLGIF